MCDKVLMTKQFIDDLGGIAAVAAHLNTSTGAVTNWRLEGRSIPWKYRPSLVALAAQKEVDLPKGFLNPEAAAA